MALNFFVSSVNTLCNKTMEDTIATVKQYETARSVLQEFFFLNAYFVSKNGFNKIFICINFSEPSMMLTEVT